MIRRFLKQDWRSGDMYLLMLSLFIAVAAVSTVSFFSDRVQRAMSHQAAELLAADLVVTSRKTLPPQYVEKAQQENMAIAKTIETRSMVVADNDELVLSEIKAVTQQYPLYGSLEVSDSPEEPQKIIHHVPAPGAVWVEQSLLNQLQIPVGSRIQIGEAFFTIKKILKHEPDRGGNIFQLGPRVLMNYEDLEKTGLIGPVSLVNYQLLVSSPSQSTIKNYLNWAKDNPSTGVRLQSLDNARPEIRNALDRARQFLGLAVIVTVIVCSVAIMVIARHFSDKQANTSAILKTFGASQGFITRLYISRIFIMAFVASSAGCLFGYAAQHIVANLLAQWFVVSLPAASITPWLVGFFVGYVVLMGFAVPPILRLSKVPPLRVFQQQLGAPNLPAIFWLGTALIAIMAVIAWLAQDITLTVIALAGIVISILLAGAMVRVLLWGLKKLPKRSLILRYGLSNVLRHKQLSLLQLIAFSLSAMVLLLLTLIRVDLLKEWQMSLNQEAPNHFLINIQPEEQTPLSDLFQQQSWMKSKTVPEQFPVIMARLKSVNGKLIQAEDYPEDSRTRWVIERDQRLSFLPELPESNKVLNGRFWNEKDKNSQETPQWSFEKSYADELGLKVGDEIEFIIAGQSAVAPITSIREIDWDSMSVNFFVLGTPSYLSKFPSTFVSSFHLPEGQDDFIVQLTREFPGITSIDVRNIVKQARNIANQATVAIEAIFGFTLIACLLVLYASIYASRQTRAKESSLLRALGATRRQLLASLAIEFSVLGLLAGIVAALVSATASYYMAVNVFALPYSINWALILGAIVMCSVVTSSAGVIGTWPLLNSPPMAALRQYDANAS